MISNENFRIYPKKKAIFISMSKKRQLQILKKNGYDQWNPFEEPNDPIDIRTDQSNRTFKELVRNFLENSQAKEYSDVYRKALIDIAIGLINNDDKYIAMYDFSIWYKNLLKKNK